MSSSVDILVNGAPLSGTNPLPTGSASLFVNGALASAANPVPVSASSLLTPTLDIAIGLSLSAAIDLGAAKLARITVPAAWTAANLTFQTSPDNVTFSDLYDKAGVEYTVTAAAAHAIAIPVSDNMVGRYIKVRSGTGALPVVQAALRTLTLSLVP